MTSMKHKSVDARRHRRSRLKRAVKPIMERFGCTQMQVADHVAGVIFQNDALRQKIEQLESYCKQLEDRNKKLKEDVDKLEDELQARVDEQ